MILRGPGAKDGNGRPSSKPNKRNRPGDIQLPPPPRFKSITPPLKATMSGFSQAAQTKPPLQQPQPSADLMQWDVNSFIFAQMGYDQPPGNNFSVPMPTNTYNSSSNPLEPSVHPPNIAIGTAGAASNNSLASQMPGIPSLRGVPLDLSGQTGSIYDTGSALDMTMWLLSTPQHLK